MSVGIKAIGSYLPQVQDCREKLERHGVDESFVVKKTGFLGNALKAPGVTASDLCVNAFQSLKKKSGVVSDDVDFVLVCTQNGDYRLPQTSAVVHDKLEFPLSCAAFDISLGCSGYVYALSVAKGFMETNGLKCGVVFTADPYSDIIDNNDKNTDLLFGDGATATLMTDEPIYELGQPVFETNGSMHQSLVCEHGGKLFMNGRNIFDFVLRCVPVSIGQCLEKNSVAADDVNFFLLHQASRFMLQNVAKRLKVAPAKVPFVAVEYGNTVSSSVPLALDEYFDERKGACMVLSGFGVGLSMATVTIQKVR